MEIEFVTLVLAGFVALWAIFMIISATCVVIMITDSGKPVFASDWGYGILITVLGPIGFGIIFTTGLINS